jgi:hypothetical protein
MNKLKDSLKKVTFENSLVEKVVLPTGSKPNKYVDNDILDSSLEFDASRDKIPVHSFFHRKNATHKSGMDVDM